MFEWSKKGLVFETARHGVGGWMRHSALTPTPYRLVEECIRVYAGFRDGDGVSRIGYVDVRADDPATIVRVTPPLATSWRVRVYSPKTPIDL